MTEGDAPSTGTHHIFYRDFSDFKYIFGFVDKLGLDDTRASNKLMAPYWHGKPVESGLPKEVFLRASGNRDDARGNLRMSSVPVLRSRFRRRHVIFSRHMTSVAPSCNP